MKNSKKHTQKIHSISLTSSLTDYLEEQDGTVSKFDNPNESRCITFSGADEIIESRRHSVFPNRSFVENDNDESDNCQMIIEEEEVDSSKQAFQVKPFQKCNSRILLAIITPIVLLLIMIVMHFWYLVKEETPV